ncbi:PREDICTED: uncharacterized protein LOC109359876 [Lupinus angustifolius]|uniref:uncharacterized protein LOC109359876 n=1 Tax=Lupinus angustifolius TaxID=3871 RepID=UPI00092E873B|nr:PREDICTED: uncharacterized protein LOC109359876 [Lupinus angustifolius]
MASNCKLTKHGSDVFEDPTFYRSIVGALQYATVTRPDITYCVNKVCQFLEKPLNSHWKAVKRIIRYLQGTQDMGLTVKPAENLSNLPIVAFCDADWASNIDDRKSTSGACLYLGPNVITWWSKKQQTISRSSTKAEYRSLALASQEIMWVESLLKELQVTHQTPIIFRDNLSTVAMSHNPVLHNRTKHIELDLHFVRDKIQDKTLTIKHILSEFQTADIFIKPLPNTQFITLRNQLRIQDCNSID